mmetsp:Transcript_31954/g.42319  ORF Transcript_31954/g.42319 Transcript_31954/m.42319 type:complete len:90 (+) Transcript_31954:635-904(+)
MILVIFGEQAFNALGRPTPEIVKSLNESKLMYGIGGFFIFAQVSQSLRSTGAFEVSIDDQLVYSKLATGKQIDVYALQDIFEPYGVKFL